MLEIYAHCCISNQAESSFPRPPKKWQLQLANWQVNAGKMLSKYQQYTHTRAHTYTHTYVDTLLSCGMKDGSVQACVVVVWQVHFVFVVVGAAVAPFA